MNGTRPRNLAINAQPDAVIAKRGVSRTTRRVTSGVVSSVNENSDRISTQRATISDDIDIISADKLTISVAELDVSADKLTISAAELDVSDDMDRISTDKLTISTAEPSLSVDELTVSAAEPSLSVDIDRISPNETKISTMQGSISILEQFRDGAICQVPHRERNPQASSVQANSPAVLKFIERSSSRGEPGVDIELRGQ